MEKEKCEGTCKHSPTPDTLQSQKITSEWADEMGADPMDYILADFLNDTSKLNPCDYSPEFEDAILKAKRKMEALLLRQQDEIVRIRASECVDMLKELQVIVTDPDLNGRRAVVQKIDEFISSLLKTNQ